MAYFRNFREILIKMRFLVTMIGTLFFGILLVGSSCNSKGSKQDKSPTDFLVFNKTQVEDTIRRLESASIDAFFENHSKFNQLKTEVLKLYQKHDFQYLWYDSAGIRELAFILHDKIHRLREEGIRTEASVHL